MVRMLTPHGSNKSPRKKRIVWTVEWIHEDQTRELDEVRETLSLSEAYKELLARKQPKSKKRKIPSAPFTSTFATSDSINESENGMRDISAIDVTTEIVGGSADNSTISPESPTIEPALESPSNEATHDNSKDISLAPSGFHFYLVKPHTSSSRRVLIPLSNEATLSTGLRGHVVLEFPTIQVLFKPPESLPSEFQLEDDYLDQELKEQSEFEELLATVQPPGASMENESGLACNKERNENLDNKKILEMLGRDLNTRV